VLVTAGHIRKLPVPLQGPYRKVNTSNQTSESAVKGKDSITQG